jgi:general nucleoside transport system ATP-binding protein
MPGEGADAQDAVLRLSGITKRFGALLANDKISLRLARGEILGLLGENGAGKTTLMNILFGHYVADEGFIEVNGRKLNAGSPGAALKAGIGMVHQHFTLADNLTVLDNIILGTEKLSALSSNRRKARARIAQLGADFGLAINPDAAISGLSVGERQRVEILKALYRNARILILDEPTAVLTPQESAALFDTLRRFSEKGLSIIFISHKLGEIMSACGRAAILRAGKLVADRSIAGATRGELAELMVGRKVAAAKAEPQEAGPVLLSLEKVSARRGNHVLDEVSLELESGQVLGIAGVSGNGQNLLADMFSGLLQPDCGTVSLNGAALNRLSPAAMVSLGIARIPEDRHSEGLIGDMSVTENVVLETYRSSGISRYGFINWAKARRFAAGIIENYDVRCPGPQASVRLLSGGNMQKLILGRVMANAPSIIRANQPTRGLDVGALNYVHEQLLAARRRGAAILLISEDLDELLALSDAVSVIYRGQLSAPVARAEANIAALGLMMAGQGFGGEMRHAS